jgi:transposase
MPTVKKITIKETIAQLKVLKRGVSVAVQKRLLMLIELKKGNDTGISKRKLSVLLGVDPNSITTWKNIYETKGIDGILKDERIGFKPSIVTKDEHIKIEKLLNDPKNGIRGYNELLDWVKKELDKDMLYITLLKYVKRNFEAKIKVARKSHIKKDKNKVEDFKKTSVKNARI